MVNKVESAGIGPGERHLNGPQTTGREFRSLSEPVYRMTTDEDVEIKVRDGSRLLADVHRPDDDGRFPALIAASPYPREIQNLGASMGFIEAGASDFFVPRGYVHLIVNLRSPAVPTAPLASSSARNARTCTTSSKGPPRSRGATARST